MTEPKTGLAQTPDASLCMNSESLLCNISAAVATLIFNRPAALNAVNVEMAHGFRDAIARVAADQGVRVLVLKGNGRAFMAGGDVAMLAADPVTNAQRIIEPLHEGLIRMAELPIPVLVSLHGAVAGAGMSIALAADLALASDDASFQMAYTKIGASPDASGTWHLPRLVGLRKALELTFLSERLDAHEALALGLVNWVVPAEQREARTNELAARLAEGPVHAYGRSKALLRASGQRTLPEQLEAERQAFVAGAAGAEFHEGTRAFMEKRPPDYLGAAT